MKQWMLYTAMVALVVGIAVVLYAAPQTGLGVPLTPGTGAQPGQPVVVPLVTQSQTEVEIRELRAEVKTLTADVAALKARVDKLEASAKTTNP